MYKNIFEENDAFMARYNEVKPYVRKLMRQAKEIGLDPEDLESELMLRIFLISKEYNEDRGTKFVTYAITCLTNQYKEIISQRMAQKRGGGKTEYSLDYTQNTNSDSDVTLLDFIAEKGDNPFEECWKKECVAAIRDFYKHFGDERIRGIICLSYQGFKQSDIAEKYDCGQSLVSFYMNKFKRELRAFLFEEGYIG